MAIITLLIKVYSCIWKQTSVTKNSFTEIHLHCIPKAALGVHLSVPLSFIQNTQFKKLHALHSRRVLRISSDRDDRRIFGGLKFSIWGFFGGVGKFWQVFFWVA